jgi:hypothetical protein
MHRSSPTGDEVNELRGWIKLGGRASLAPTLTVPRIIFQRPAVVHEARGPVRAPRPVLVGAKGKGLEARRRTKGY